MATVRQTTAVRFGLRGLLIVIAAVATYCAAVAPAFRSWSHPERGAFLMAWGGALLGWIGVVGIYSALRLRAERSAGPVRLSLRIRRAPLGLLVWVITAAAVIALLAVWPLTAATYARIQAEAAAMGRAVVPGGSQRLGISLGALAGLLTTLLWWRGERIEFCDCGLLSFVTCTSWPAVDYEWLSSERGLLMLLLGRNRLQVVVPDELRTEVHYMLSRRYVSLVMPGDRRADSETLQ